jgi:hypothetical protein
MPAASCVVLLIVALVIDLLSVGPGSIRDRIAFLLAVPALYAGWAGDSLAIWVNTQLAALTGMGLKASGSVYIAGAEPAIVVSAVVAAAFVYAIGAMLPRRAQRWAGPIAKFDLARGKASMSAGGRGKRTPGGGLGDAPQGSRLNLKLWGLALFLALTVDLPRGAIGQAIAAVMGALTWATAGIPNWLIGRIS